MKKLDGIGSAELQELAKAIKKSTYSAYQELMVVTYLKDIDHFLNDEKEVLGFNW